MDIKDSVTIRTATTADAQALLNIYAPYVEHTAITFEYDVPSAEEFASRIEYTLQKSRSRGKQKAAWLRLRQSFSCQTSIRLGSRNLHLC